MSARKQSQKLEGAASLSAPVGSEIRRSGDNPTPGATLDKRSRHLSGPPPPQPAILDPKEIKRKGWATLKEKKRYFALRDHDLFWWNEMPVEKFEVSSSQLHNKTAGRIALGTLPMSVRDGATINVLAESGDAYSLKCPTSADAEEWFGALGGEGSGAHTERGKRDTKFGWIIYGEKKRILYLGVAKLDILDANLALRRVIPLEGRSVKADRKTGFEVYSAWSTYSFSCGSNKERDSWVRRISLQIIRANTVFDAHAWERKGYLALDKRKSCFFGLKSGKLYYYRSAKQGTGKRFVLADCLLRKVENEDDVYIELELKSAKYHLRSHSREDLDSWYLALQGAQRGKAVSSSGAVFGSVLSTVTSSAAYSRAGIPVVVLDVAMYLDQPTAFATEGLFHQSIDLQAISSLIDAFNAGTPPSLTSLAVPYASAACLLKHFLKSLPMPLIPESLQWEVLEARSDSIELRYVLGKVPKDERSILKIVFELLNNLAFESRLDSNSAVELATVITPLVLWRPKNTDADPDEEDLFLLKGVMAIGTLINRYDDVFEEVQDEVLAMKKDIGADHFDKLLAQLAGAAQVPAATAPKKPLPSLEDWAKELRSGPARPLLPEAFLQAAAEKEHEEGLDALAELEHELEVDKVERKHTPSTSVVVSAPVALVISSTAPAAAGATSLQSSRTSKSGETAALKAARPKKKKGVRMTTDDAEATKQRVQNATLMRTLRQSRKSRLTPEELAAVKEKLESHMGSVTGVASGSNVSAPPGTNYKRHNTEPRRRDLPRNDTAINTLDDLFDELQKEKISNPKDMLKRITTSSRLLQHKQDSNPMLATLDMFSFLTCEAKLSDDAARTYLPMLDRNGLDGRHLHLITIDLLFEIGVRSSADRAAVAEAAQRISGAPKAEPKD